MADLPNVEEIGEILAFIRTRDQATTAVEQFDRDHGVLLESQAEVTEAVMRELPAGYPATKDDLRALLGRIQDAIVVNRAQREAAFARNQ